jgi:hypothetical protein
MDDTVALAQTLIIGHRFAPEALRPNCRQCLLEPLCQGIIRAYSNGAGEEAAERRQCLADLLREISQDQMHRLCQVAWLTGRKQGAGS